MEQLENSTSDSLQNFTSALTSILNGFNSGIPVGSSNVLIGKSRLGEAAYLHQKETQLVSNPDFPARPSYQQQFDKITKAYMNDKLEPRKTDCCFVGNLLDGYRDWVNLRLCYKNGMLKKAYMYNYKIDCHEHFTEIHDFYQSTWANHYSIDEIIELEQTFFNYLFPFGFDEVIDTEKELKLKDKKIVEYLKIPIEEYEKRLYLAMEVALKKLKEIHEKYGEVIEKSSFKKRELQNLTV